MRREEKWMTNYRMLESYVIEHGQFPDKKKVDNRGLLNWWKYNMKKLKAGTLCPQQLELLERLSEARTTHRPWGKGEVKKSVGGVRLNQNDVPVCNMTQASEDFPK